MFDTAFLTLGLRRSRALGLAAVAGCGGTGPVDPSQACGAQPVTVLAVGQHVVLDPAASDGCLRIPEAGPAGAQYLLVLASTNGARSANGIQGTYLLRASSPAVSPGPAGVSVSAAGPAQVAPLRVAPLGLGGPVSAWFDATLRAREREVAADPVSRRPLVAPTPLAAPPPLGEVRTFKVCSSLKCTGFTDVTATARYVGEHSAVYLDNEASFLTDPVTDGDLAELGFAFDIWHYPIDTTAFGRESDIDGNGVVIILMTKAVNDLTPDCEAGRVVGYFFGGDLLVRDNSNRAEIFFTLVPAPATPKCSAVSPRAVLNNAKATLMHEFQHMINFNQHVLKRPGGSEDTWLNEALAHYAEELGGRLIPSAECEAFGFPSCRSQYSSGNLINGYNYLRATDTNFVVFPNSKQGTLAERGAGWLLLRWAIDQFAGDSILGTAMTRDLVETSQTGAANLTGATGVGLDVMIPEWLLALYLDDGSDLPSEPTGRLRFKSWGFRAIWSDPDNFTTGFPLVPPSILGNFLRSGALKAGSGQHFLVLQGASTAAINLQALKNSGGARLDPALQARFGVVRIR